MYEQFIRKQSANTWQIRERKDKNHQTNTDLCGGTCVLCESNSLTITIQRCVGNEHMDKLKCQR